MEKPGSSARGRRGILTLMMLLVPACFLGSAFQFKEARGPYWLGTNNDPEYAYLLNSLMLAEGRTPTHFHHPGTTLQTLGALTLRVSHALRGQKTLQEDVLRRPEHYLDTLHQVLAVLSFLLLAATGLLVLRATGDWKSALLLQAAPFLSKEALICSGRVHAETLLLPLVVLWGGLLFCVLRSPSADSRRWPLGLGLVAGLSLATKVTSLPLIFLPLFLLADRKARKRFGLVCLGTTLLCISPILSQLGALLSWQAGLFLRSGFYGQGPFDPFHGGILWGLERLLSGNPTFQLQLGLGALVLVWLLWRLKRDQAEKQTDFRRAWTAIFCTQLLLLLVASRQSYVFPRYLLPVSCLFGLNLALLRGQWPHGLRWQAAGFTALLALGVVRAQDLHHEFQSLRIRNQEQTTIAAIASIRFPQTTRVYYSNASSPQNALHFGNGYAGYTYARALDRIYPSTFFFNIWSQVFTNFQRPVSGQLLRANPSGLFLQGSTRRAKNGLPFPKKAIYPGKYESLFRIEGDTISMILAAKKQSARKREDPGPPDDEP